MKFRRYEVLELLITIPVILLAEKQKSLMNRFENWNLEFVWILRFGICYLFGSLYFIKTAKSAL